MRMKKDENLEMALNFANGTDIKADLSNITVDRINDGSVIRTGDTKPSRLARYDCDGPGYNKCWIIQIS